MLPPPFSLIPLVLFLEFSFSSSTTRTIFILIQADDAGFNYGLGNHKLLFFWFIYFFGVGMGENGGNALFDGNG